MKDVRPRAPWSEGSRIGANLRNCLKNAEDQSFVCCLFVGRAVVRVSVRCPVESARRLWRVRLCPCSNFSFVRAPALGGGAHSAKCVLQRVHHTSDGKSARFLPLTAAALQRVVAMGDHMLPAGAATGRFCALQSAICGSVARAQSVCAQSATAKRPPGAQQWSSQQRAKSSVLQFMQELAESLTMLLQPLFHGLSSHFELRRLRTCRVCRYPLFVALVNCSQQR